MKNKFTSALSALAIVVAISGCSLRSAFTDEDDMWPYKDPRKVCTTTSCNRTDAMVAYINAKDFCRKVQNYYEKGGNISDSTKFGIGMFGTLAGAVFAPISHGTASTAWSGLSGATNGIQASFDETFSASVRSNRLSAVAVAAQTGDTAYQNAGDDNAKRVEAAVNMATACANAPAVADKKTLEAVSGIPPTSPQGVAVEAQKVTAANSLAAAKTEGETNKIEKDNVAEDKKIADAKKAVNQTELDAKKIEQKTQEISEKINEPQ